MANYSELSMDQLGELLSRYGLRLKTSTQIDGGAANTSYRIHCADDSAVILTIVDNAINLPVQTLANLLRYLTNHRVSTTSPLQSRNGKLVERLNDRPILVKRYIEGNCYDALPNDHLAAAGKALAKVHTLPVPPWLPSGSRRLPNVREHLAEFQDKEFANWILDRLAETEAMFAVDSPLSIVHGDYFSDNLIVDSEGNIFILDWETASSEVAIVDLGFAAVGLACTGGVFDSERMRAFLDGYQAIRPLSDEEGSHLRDAVICAATYIGYRRYERHHIRYPNPAKHFLYQEMPEFVDSVKNLWDLRI